MATVPPPLSLAQSLSRIRRHLRWPDELPLLAPPDAWVSSGAGAASADGATNAADAADVSLGSAGWQPAESILTDDATIARLVDANAKRVGARQQSPAATLLWKDYCQSLTLLPVASWFVDRRVPDMALANVSLRVATSEPLLFPALRSLRGHQLDGEQLGDGDLASGEGGTSDRTAAGGKAVPDLDVGGVSLGGDAPHVIGGAGGAGGEVTETADRYRAAVETVADEDALDRRLATTLWDEHLAVAADSFSTVASVDPVILRGLAASVAVAALPRVAALAEGADSFAAAQRIITAMGAENLIEIASLTPPGGVAEPMALRFVCCQAYRVPPARNCSTCPLLTDDGRDEVLTPYGYHWSRLPR